MRPQINFPDLEPVRVGGGEGAKITSALSSSRGPNPLPPRPPYLKPFRIPAVSFGVLHGPKPSPAAPFKPNQPAPRFTESSPSRR